MDAAQLGTELATRFRGAGLAGRGMRLHQRLDGVTWVVEVERARYLPQYDVVIGVDLDAHRPPPPVHLCQVFVDVVLFLKLGENGWWVPGDGTGWRELGEALSIGSSVDDVERRRRLDLLVRILSGYMAENSTRDAIDRAVVRGDFDCGFVHKDVRQRLDAWPAATVSTVTQR